MSIGIPVPTHEQILQALDRTGYMFEQSVAKSLGPDVSTGWAFKDQDTGASREVDIYKLGYVRAHNYQSDKSVSVRWVVLGECKNYQWPWAALTKSWDRPSFQDWPELAISLASKVELGVHDYAGRSSDSFRSRYHDIRYARHPRAVQLVKLNKKSAGWEASSGDVFNDLTYPLAKATAFLQSRFNRNGEKGDLDIYRREVTVIFPTIFLSSDIFTVSASEEQPVVERCKHVILERQLSSESTSGLFRYDVVHIDGIKEWYNNHVLEVVNGILDIAGYETRHMRHSRAFEPLH